MCMTSTLRSLFRTLLMAVLAVGLAAPHAAADLLVSDNFGNQVLRYDQTTGAFVGVLISSNPITNGGLNGPVGLRQRSNGNLLVTSQNDNRILEYDVNTGAFLGTFSNDSTLAGPADLRFGPSGNLYVANFFGGSVAEFSPTGTALGHYTSGGPGIAGAASFAFDSNSHLFVGSFNTGEIQHFDENGAYVSPPLTTGMSGPAGLHFDLDGTLWATSLFSHEIWHIDSDGTVLDTFSTGADTFPSHILVNPNNTNELLVALTGGGGIYRFGKDGTPNGIFAFGGGLLVPGQMLFTATAIPEPSSIAVLAVGFLAFGVYRHTRRRKLA